MRREDRTNPSPPVTLPLSDLLKEAHRLLDRGRVGVAERASKELSRRSAKGLVKDKAAR